MDNLSNTTNTLVEEGYQVLNLDEMAERPSGAWPNGWYPAEVIEGFEKGGHQFDTANQVSKDGQSFNLRLCFRIINSDQMRTDFAQLNYRPNDFTPDRIEAVKNLRKAFEGVGGSWQGYKDEQRSSLALAKLGQLGKAAEVQLAINAETGAISPFGFLGKKFFIKYGTNEEGYNEIKAFSKFQNGVEPRARKAKKSRS